MKVHELIKWLKKFPPDYTVEIKEGTDHWTPGHLRKDGHHKRSDFWQRQRKVVYIEPGDVEKAMAKLYKKWGWS